jgi:hypothetical protein
MSETQVDMDTAVAKEMQEIRGTDYIITLIGTMREACFMAGCGLKEVDELVGRVPMYLASEEEGCSEDISYFCKN